MWTTKSDSRRDEIHKNRPDTAAVRWREMRASGAFPSMVIAFVFFLVITGVLMMREDVVSYRPGQYAAYDITSRVDFNYPNREELARLREIARRVEPRVYQEEPSDFWGYLQDRLLALPDLVHQRTLLTLPDDLRAVLDDGALTALEQATQSRQSYEGAVRRYIAAAKQAVMIGGNPLVILEPADRQKDLDRKITLHPAAVAGHPTDLGAVRQVATATETYPQSPPPSQVRQELEQCAKEFDLALGPKIAKLTLNGLFAEPTHRLDPIATAAAAEQAAKNVPESDALEHYLRNMVIVPRGVIQDSDYQKLKAENSVFIASADSGRWKQRAGLALTVLVIVIAMSAYIGRYQRRIVRNHARAIAIGVLLVSMLLLSELAAAGPHSVYVFGILPSILVGMILTIAYDQRFAIGIGSLHAILVTAAVCETPAFFLILWIGVLVSCFLLDEIRTRSKLIEVGAAAALAMTVVTIAGGLLSLDPLPYIGRNCMLVFLSGLASGFVVLGILPFIERIFRITTGMTLLELADASNPLLRRLAVEAPGTYSHSLQVASLAEAAAEAIKANSLACRVGAYYHDIGKINKPDYFVENQQGGQSRHLNLSPRHSLAIIIGHVKDGIALAKEYHLPTSLLPFIQQHHGTTLVEYFYNQACKESAADCADHEPGPQVSEMQYRYPGPKPKSKETAILMLCDCVESASRAMRDPDAVRIKDLVFELTRKRLQDGQFDECDLTMHDLDLIRHSLIKSLLGVYHGRVSYPSTEQMTGVNPPVPQQQSAARSA